MPRPATRILALLFCAAAALAGLAPSFAGDPPRPDIALIVNADNDVADPTLDEVAAYYRLDRQFWPSGDRVVLLLRPRGSPPREALLERVFKMSDEELRKFWARRLFAGEIQAIPSVVPTDEAVLAAVRRSKGALAAIVARDLGEGVRVLRIDGKKPGEKGYPLAFKPGS